MNILTPWANYFVAQAGAAGALTGLIFVALSLNFDQIISDPAWLGRAGTGLILLAQPIAYALVCLWPARLIVTLTEPAATITGSALVATGHAAGAFVQASGALAGLAIGLLTAWILLVEVRRTRPAIGGPATGDHLRPKRRTEPGALVRVWYLACAGAAAPDERDCLPDRGGTECLSLVPGTTRGRDPRAVCTICPEREGGNAGPGRSGVC